MLECSRYSSPRHEIRTLKGRYLAVGRQVTMTELLQILEKSLAFRPQQDLPSFRQNLCPKQSEALPPAHQKPILVTNELAHLAGRRISQK